MEKQRIEIEVDVPSGFEAVAYRKPSAGEWYEYGGVAHQACIEFTRDSHLILRRVEPKRESRWINAYSCNDVNPKVQFHTTLAGAIAAQGDRRPMPVARFDYENDRIVSVALESVEGKG